VMSIRDYSESERHYEHGRNMVWRDVGKHRHLPTSNSLDSHGRALEYSPAYILSLPNTIVKCLEYTARAALPAPAEAQLARDDAELPAVCEPQNHVLPRPLIDIIVSVSRLSLRDGIWMKSELRVPWAQQKLDETRKLLQAARCDEAAQTISSVFGTLLPGFLSGRLTSDEDGLFRASWATLGELVDASFISALIAEIGGDRHARSLEDLRRRNSIMPEQDFKRVGSPELLLAEDIKELDLEIARLRSIALPPGKVEEYEILSFKRYRPRTLRIVGEGVMIFAPGHVGEKHSLDRYACWVIDQSRRRPRLKLWKMRRWLADEINRRTSDTIRAEWHPISFKNSRSKADFSFIPAGQKPLSPDEEVLCKRADRSSIEAYYNGRAYVLDKIGELTSRRDVLIDRFMEMTK
jgi:hypothetical protein